MTVPTFIADYRGTLINAQDVADMPPDRRFRDAWVIDPANKVIRVEVKKAKQVAEDMLRQEVRVLAESNAAGNRAAVILGEDVQRLPDKGYPAKLKAIKQAKSIGELEMLLS